MHRLVRLVSASCLSLQVLEELRAEAAEAEARRLRRKERSERIPTAPKKTQDPILFQAITRDWDEKMSLEERRGARAAARKVRWDSGHAAVGEWRIPMWLTPLATQWTDGQAIRLLRPGCTTVC